MISERRNGELYLSDGDWKRQAHYYSSVSSELETVNFSCYITRMKQGTFSCTEEEKEENWNERRRQVLFSTSCHFIPTEKWRLLS